MLTSALYTGSVRHRRRHPPHAFSFPLFMVYLDLAELDQVLARSRLWGTSRFHVARFRRKDYMGGAESSLDQSVRDIVRQHIGRAPDGPIRMLTHLRYYGYIFNPVTFYYCFDHCDQVDAVVAEITNTPWGERHVYVLDAHLADLAGASHRWRFGKNFHISPFLPMDLDYDWCLATPGDTAFIHMNLLARDNTRTFDATLTLKRRELTPSSMRNVLLRYPFMTAHVLARIHFEALRLWLKRARVHSHPARTSSASTMSQGSRP